MLVTEEGNGSVGVRPCVLRATHTDPGGNPDAQGHAAVVLKESAVCYELGGKTVLAFVGQNFQRDINTSRERRLLILLIFPGICFPDSLKSCLQERCSMVCD